MTSMKTLIAAVALLAVLAAVSAAPVDEQAPETFRVELQTTVKTGDGKIVIDVQRPLSPHGADRFYTLVKAKYYNSAGFFRVVPNFVVQFGIAADPAVSAVWKNRNIPDDPVRTTNAPGTLVFASAGPNTRTTQLFLNLRANANLDGMGFSPFGKIVQGMDVLQAITSQYGEQPNQSRIHSEGNAYLRENFPNLDYVKSIRILQ